MVTKQRDMSLSKPESKITHPCGRWLEWQGSKGTIIRYDKEQKKNVDHGYKIAFVVLDQLNLITGWDDASSSGVTSNEIRHPSTDILAVRSFKGGTLFNGLYSAIRDKVAARKLKYTAKIYIATRVEKTLTMAAIQFHGAALNAWIEFYKNNRAYVDAGGGVEISGVVAGQKGGIKFVSPVFGKRDVSPDTVAAAVILDGKLQAYLDEYFKKQATPPAAASAAGKESAGDDDYDEPLPEEPAAEPAAAPEDSDECPF